MNRLKGLYVWMRRIRNWRGFGIQSPTDYAFVRYVINEHWPYYQYKTLGQNDDWLTRKLGRLYFRLANWRQPTAMLHDRYENYWRAGCRRVTFADTLERVEMARIDCDEQRFEQLAARCDDRSAIIIEGIFQNDTFWQRVKDDVRVSITYDLYYCGIVFFDPKRVKQHYVINF